MIPLDWIQLLYKKAQYGCPPTALFYCCLLGVLVLPACVDAQSFERRTELIWNPPFSVSRRTEIRAAAPVAAAAAALLLYNPRDKDSPWELLLQQKGRPGSQRWSPLKQKELLFADLLRTQEQTFILLAYREGLELRSVDPGQIVGTILWRLPWSITAIEGLGSYHGSRGAAIVLRQQDDEEREQVQVLGIAPNGALLIQETFDIPNEGYQFLPVRAAFDASGTLLLLAELRDATERELQRGQPNYKYTLFNFSRKAEQDVAIALQVEGRLILEADFTLIDEELHLVALSSQVDLRRAGELVWMELDETQVLQNSRALSIPKDIRGQMLTERAERVDPPEFLEEFHAPQLLRLAGTLTLFIAEQQYVVTGSSSFADGGSYRRYMYNNRDLLLAGFRPNGTALHLQRWPKRQISINDDGRYNSYSAFAMGEQALLLYNDSGRNYRRKELDQFVHTFSGNRRGAVCTALRISADGSVQREPLFIADDYEVLNLPQFNSKINEEQILLCNRSARAICLAWLEWE